MLVCCKITELNVSSVILTAGQLMPFHKFLRRQAWRWQTLMSLKFTKLLLWVVALYSIIVKHSHTTHTVHGRRLFSLIFRAHQFLLFFLLIFCLVSCSRLRWPAVIFERTLNCATCKLNILQVNPHYLAHRRHRHHHHHICHCILIFLLNLFLICASSWDRPKLFLFFCCLSAIAKFSQ